MFGILNFFFDIFNQFCVSINKIGNFFCYGVYIFSEFGYEFVDFDFQVVVIENVFNVN